MSERAGPASDAAMMSIAQAAQDYARRGWSIFPIKPGTKKPCVKWGPYQNRLATAEEIDGWFSGRKRPGLAVVLGAVSGHLVCRDYDDAAAYERWAATYPDLAGELPTVKTARGYHVYFTCAGVKTRAFSDGELRGEGSYCVVPPSQHPDGGVYTWIVPLPAGDLPSIKPAEVGLVPAGLQQKKTEEGQKNTETHTISSVVFRSLLSSSVASEIEKWIAATIPTAKGMRHRCVFKLARALKGIPEFANTNPEELREYVKAWHTQALVFIGTPEFEETWIDFVRAWPRVRNPLEHDILADAFERAKANPIDTGYESAAITLLAGLCRELQSAVGDAEFWLSCRSGARLFAVEPSTISRWLWLLEHNGWITTIEKGTQRDNKATRFRFNAKQSTLPEKKN